MHSPYGSVFQRRGFSLIEILVAVGIIGLLVALLIPAIQQARIAARRTDCLNRLKQIGLAMHSYHEVHKSLPSGYITGLPQDLNATELSHWSWGTFLLPYLDQTSLYQKLQPTNTSLHDQLASPDGVAALTTPLSVFTCPSDIGPSMNNFTAELSDNPSDVESSWYNRLVTSNGTDRFAIAKSNYVMVACSSISIKPPADFKPYGPATGVGFQNSGVKFSDITDGTTNTFLVGERSFKVGDLNVGAANCLGFSSKVNVAGIAPAAMSVLGIPYYGINWQDGKRVHQTRGFHSQHAAGAYFLLCDGTVRFVSENINYNFETVPGELKDGAWIDSVYERLCGKSDGQTVGDY